MNINLYKKLIRIVPVLFLLLTNTSFALLSMQTELKLKRLGFRLTPSAHKGDCLYDAIGGQTGQTSQQLKEELHQCIAAFLQNPNPEVFDQLDSLLRSQAIGASMNELANFYLDGRLRRDGEWGELMLLPFVVYTLNRPIILLNLSTTLRDQPSLFIQTDLTFTEITTGSARYYANTQNAIVLLFSDDAYYGVIPTSPEPALNWQQSLIVNLDYLQNIASSRLNPIHIGSDQNIPSDNNPLSTASIPGRDYESPIRQRMVKHPCNPLNPRVETPCFGLAMTTIKSQLDGFYLFHPDEYLRYLTRQLQLYTQNYSVQWRTKMFLNSLKQEGASNKPKKDNTAKASGLKVKQLIDLFNTPVLLKQSTTKPTTQSSDESKFHKKASVIPLEIPDTKTSDTCPVFWPEKYSISGVPENYQQSLAKAANEQGIMFGNRNVAAGARIHLEKPSTATKNYKIKQKTSDLSALSSLIPTTPSLSKDRKKSEEEQDEVRAGLQAEITNGQLGVFDFSLSEENIKGLVDSCEVTIEAEVTTKDGRYLRALLRDCQTDNSMQSLTLIREDPNEDWCVYWTKDGQLTRVKIVTDRYGRIITADLDPLFIVFKLEDLDLAHQDKLPLPLITPKPTNARIHRLNQIQKTSIAQIKSLNSLTKGMEDFFMATVFVKCRPPSTESYSAQPDKKHLSELIFLNPQLPTLRVLEQNWNTFQKTWINTQTEQGEHLCGYLVNIPREHPDMGNVNPRAIELVKTMNTALGRPANNPAVHHNHDAHSLASKEELNYPADIYTAIKLETSDENGRSIVFPQGVVQIRNNEEAMDFVLACKDNHWFITLNHSLWPGLSAVRSRHWRNTCHVLNQFLANHLLWLQEKDKPQRERR